MAELAALADSAAAGRRRRWRLVVVLAAGLWVAAVPAAAVLVRFVFALIGGGHVDLPHAVRAVLAAAVFGLAVPVGLLQQAVGAWEWTHAAGVPSRAWLQVINIPGKHQEPYDWDARSRILGGYWDTGTDPAYAGAAVEAVASDRSDMFTALAWAEDDNVLSRGNTHCRRQGPGLWQCVTTATDPEETAFVRRSGGVMIILTGDDSASVLLRSIQAAHPATNPELWSRTVLAPLSPLGWLLL
jgi:hypothetical protein